MEVIYLEKRFVPVTVRFDENGKRRPLEIEYDKWETRARDLIQRHNA